jgi:transglutaminase-like putative cysteine protease
MHYQVNHTTTYEYTEPVSLCQNVAHLTPRAFPAQRCLHTNLFIDPEPAVMSDRTDYFGNPATFFAVQKPHRKLTATASHLVEVIPGMVHEPGQTPPWEEVRDQLPTGCSPSVLDAYQFVFASRYIQASSDLAGYTLPSFTAGRPILEAVLDLTRRIHHDFLYDPRATTVATPLHKVFANRRGVCQDFAHLQIACLRSLRLAARYVSGYLCTHPHGGQERLIGADATHAWLSVYCGSAGWVDADPTNNQVPSDKHILLAWGRDYDDVSPIKGVILGGGEHTVSVAVEVTAPN